MRNTKKKWSRWLTEHGNERGNEIITIPVVVHVVWNTNTQNISLAQIESQIDVLNEDFARLNDDADETPTPFQSVAAATNFRFCLATIDPDGNETDGVNRVQTNDLSFNDNDDVKYASEGGADAWEPHDYFNIWVCNLSGGLLGYAQFPDDPNEFTYGVVIDYQYFGTIGTATPPFHLGRTTTHEVGHCFGLYHIWGDDNGFCSGSDNVSDTPNQADATNGCASFPETDNCTTGGNGVMYMNYMDYSNDNCLNMFTTGQANRMLSQFMASDYDVLANSTVCNSLVPIANDAGVESITTPGTTVCANSFAPVVRIKNYGTNTITSVKINYKVDNGTVQVFNWTGSMAPNTIKIVTLNTVSVSSGAHTFTAYTSNPNGLTDGNAANNQKIKSFTVDANLGQSPPLTQGMESTTFPSGGWTVVNADGATTWQRTTAAKKTGAASAMVNNFDYENAAGQRDDFVSPRIDLSSMSAATLTFQVAYTSYTDFSVSGNTWDTLQVILRPVCGGNDVLLYSKYGEALSTAPNTTSAFVPTASQWRLETINLNSYLSYGSVQIIFRNISHYENNLYLDDINVSGTVGIDDPIALAYGVSVSPNPFSGSTEVRYTLPQHADVRCTVFDVWGRELKRFDQANQAAGAHTLSLTESDLPIAGVYFVRLQIGNAVVTQKVMKR